MSLDLDPPYLCPDYQATVSRAPTGPLLPLPPGPTERHGPVFGARQVAPEDGDLTRSGPIGERIIVTGQVRGPDGLPLPGCLVEIWQANAAGRYAHQTDQHPAPLDPDFTGAGRALTDGEGRYRFTTIRPGAYPWANHANAWRPAHIHFSVFGRGFAERLVTQMYFPGDPLLQLDPMYRSIRDRRAAELLLGRFDLATTMEGWALGYQFDIMIGGRDPTPPAPA